jgi:8-oxo-dGTP pyrophosphatase MutT (NUDIX family)
MPDADVPVRDAATLILWRDGPSGAEVLMGQRGGSAAFMPSKYVFPGGAVDDADAGTPLARPLSEVCAGRLAIDGARPAVALAAAAIRELWEEAGLRLGMSAKWPGQPQEAWRSFASGGAVPDAAALSFVFRAITPPGRPRRFDARFFLANAASVLGDPDDFGQATDELSHLHWVPLAEARRLNLPFVTEVVIAEAAQLVTRGGPPARVPFFDNSGPEPRFRWIG